MKAKSLLVLLAVLCIFSLGASPPQQGMNMRIWADEYTIVRGQCTFLRWQTTNARNVELWEKPTDRVAVGGVITVPDASTRIKIVALSGEEKVCPTTTMAYAFVVTNMGGFTGPPVGLTIAVVDSPASPIEPVEPADPAIADAIPERVEGTISEIGSDKSLTNRLAGQVYAAENPFNWGQCTWYVYRLRPDVDTWINRSGGNDAHKWNDLASAAGLSVDHNPRIGDIAVWEQSCGGPYAIAGHVAYVREAWKQNGIQLIKVDESNYNGDLKEHKGVQYNVNKLGNCISFIHASQSNRTPEVTAPKQQSTGWWDRLRHFFGFK